MKHNDQSDHSSPAKHAAHDKPAPADKNAAPNQHSQADLNKPVQAGNRIPDQNPRNESGGKSGKSS